MARNGKIARLPKYVRDELNARLQDGEPGQQLVQWLNELHVTMEMLADYFGGRPINEQNLTEWKQGGYQDWLRSQQTCERVDRMVDRAQDLDDAAQGKLLSDRLSSILAAELADAVEKLNEIADPNERWHRLQEILCELSRLRKEDHHSRSSQIQKEKWERQKDREDEEEEKRTESERKNRILSFLNDTHAMPLTERLYGGGEYGKYCAEVVFAVNHNQPLPCRPKNGHQPPESPPDNQTQSGLIKPNQTQATAM